MNKKLQDKLQEKWIKRVNDLNSKFEKNIFYCWHCNKDQKSHLFGSELPRCPLCGSIMSRKSNRDT